MEKEIISCIRVFVIINPIKCIENIRKLDLILKWEGDNQEDTNYEKYEFETVESFKGFIWSIENYPRLDLNIKEKSLNYLHGYEIGQLVYKLWKNKYAEIVYRKNLT